MQGMVVSDGVGYVTTVGARLRVSDLSNSMLSHGCDRQMLDSAASVGLSPDTDFTWRLAQT